MAVLMGIKIMWPYLDARIGYLLRYRNEQKFLV